MDFLLTLLAPELLRTLFDQLPDTMFFVKDAQARYVLVNQTMVKRSGKQRSEDVVRQTVEALFPGVFGRNTTQADLQVIARGEAVQGRLELYHLPQERQEARPGAPARWCLTHKYPLWDAQGRVAGLVGISRDLPRPDERSQTYHQLAQVAAHIGEHYGERLLVPELARMAGLSEDRLERSVQQVFGLSPKQLLMKVRLEAASSLLRQTSKTVSEVAHACGYADHSAFTRLFRRAVGLTPSQYRGLLGERPGAGVR